MVESDLMIAAVQRLQEVFSHLPMNCRAWLSLLGLGGKRRKYGETKVWNNYSVKMYNNRILTFR